MSNFQQVYLMLLDADAIMTDWIGYAQDALASAEEAFDAEDYDDAQNYYAEAFYWYDVIQVAQGMDYDVGSFVTAEDAYQDSLIYGYFSEVSDITGYDSSGQDYYDSQYSYWGGIDDSVEPYMSQTDGANFDSLWEDLSRQVADIDDDYTYATYYMGLAADSLSDASTAFDAGDMVTSASCMSAAIGYADTANVYLGYASDGMAAADTDISALEEILANY